MARKRYSTLLWSSEPEPRLQIQINDASRAPLFEILCFIHLQGLQSIYTKPRWQCGIKSVYIFSFLFFFFQIFSSSAFGLFFDFLIFLIILPPLFYFSFSIALLRHSFFYAPYSKPPFFFISYSFLSLTNRVFYISVHQLSPVISSLLFLLLSYSFITSFSSWISMFIFFLYLLFQYILSSSTKFTSLYPPSSLFPLLVFSFLLSIIISLSSSLPLTSIYRFPATF